MSVFSYVLWDKTPNTQLLWCDIQKNFFKFGQFYDAEILGNEKYGFMNIADFGYLNNFRPAAWIPDFDYIQDSFRRISTHGNIFANIDQDTKEMLFSDGIAAVYVDHHDNPHFEYNPMYPKQEELGTNNGVGDLVVFLSRNNVAVWVIHLIISDWKNEDPFTDHKFEEALIKTFKWKRLTLSEWIPVCYDFELNTPYEIRPDEES